MKCIAMVNIKGGVGKTVSAVNVATCLAQANKKTLLIDLDPQSNATQYLGLYNPSAICSYDILMNKELDIKEAIQESTIKNLDVVPANIKLIICENEIVTNTKRSRENRLNRALESINKEYDYCVIDCPPNLGIITTNALVACENVLVPIKIDKFALDGFEYLIETIEEIRDEFNSSLKLSGVFITMDKHTRVNKDIKEELKKVLGNKLMDVSIRENVKVVQSTFEEKPVVIYDKKAIASQDYIKLTKEVLMYV